MATGTTPFGLEDPPLDPLRMFLSYGISFVARGFSSDVKGTSALIQQAAAHEGFAVLQLISPCPTFNKVVTFDAMKARVAPVPDDHDATDLAAAMALALDHDRVYTGVFYRAEGLATMEQKLDHQRKLTMDRQPRSVERIFEQFKS
jgi:2-oxoglutarate ferredoxin oxidoreductase subunit beta